MLFGYRMQLSRREDYQKYLSRYRELEYKIIKEDLCQICQHLKK